MLRAIKIRLYPNKTQEEYILSLLGSYRFVYNQCLALKKEKYTEESKNYGLKELGNFFHQDLTKDENYTWLRDHNTKVLKQSVINLLDSYKRFFVNGNGFPKFKSKHDNQQSCRFPSEAISKKNDYESNRISLTNNIKDIKFKCSDKYKSYLNKHKSNIKSATLTKTKSGNYFLSILVDGDLMKSKSQPTNDFIGLDLGIKDFIITSEGETFDNIKIKRSNQKKLAKLHRELSRKQKGGSNRNKSKIKLAKLYEKLNNKKQNYLHHITNQLLDENQVIVIEDLNVKGMMKNHNLAKSIQELSLYRFKEMLRYKAEWYGNHIVEIDRFFPSSKLCNSCGHKNSELKLSDREWTCSSCGTKHDRDLNAAINILNEGKRILNNKIPTRCGKLTPLETSGYTVDELGNRDLRNFS
jgi:putative transposase